jgi:nucleotidyltransferase substrate binding protein (TIGR01987 family)
MEQINRWRQRLEDLKKAYGRLKEALARTEFDELEKDGVIQRFEFTFELVWKTMKDYLEDQGVINIASPKKTLRKAFQDGLFANDELWLQMLEDRNNLSHLYKQEMSDNIFKSIKEIYSQAIDDLISTLEKE